MHRDDHPSYELPTSTDTLLQHCRTELQCKHVICGAGCVNMCATRTGRQGPTTASIHRVVVTIGEVEFGTGGLW
jgi:hypothetical protein